MYIIFTENSDSWHSQELKKSLNRLKRKVQCFSITNISLSTSKPKSFIHNKKIIKYKDVKGVFVRAIPNGTFEEVIYYLNILHIFELNNVVVYNNPTCIEQSVDKVRTTMILKKHNINTPDTIITSKISYLNSITKNLKDNESKVIKPIFGSMGRGLEKIDKTNIHPDYDLLNGVYYIQEFIKSKKDQYHDWRLFVIKNKVTACMKRVGNTWINNVSKGATCNRYKPSLEMKKLAIDSLKALNMNYAGVDIMKDHKGKLFVTEVNSIPAWEGLQSVYPKISIADQIISDFIKKCQKKR